MQQYYRPTQNPIYDPYVQFVQEQLNRLRMTLLHDIPKVDPVDGKYGSQTAMVVKAFQKKCNICDDGVWGPKSRTELAQKMREQPALSRQPEKTKFPFLPGLIKTACGIVDTVSKQALKEVERVSKMSGALSSRDIQEIPERLLKNNKPLKEIQQAMKNLWAKQDEVRCFLTTQSQKAPFLALTRKGISKKHLGESMEAIFARQQLNHLNNLPEVKKANEAFKMLYDRYVMRMQTFNFTERIQQRVNRIPKVGTSVKVGRLFKPLAFLPLIIDGIAIVCFAWHGLPMEELLDQTFKDLCDLIEGYIITAIVGYVVVAAGLTGGVAIVVVLVIMIIIAVICEIFDVHIIYNLCNVLTGLGQRVEAVERVTGTNVVGPKYL